MDYNEEARKLFSVMGLDKDGHANKDGRTKTGGLYNDCDCVFKDPRSGGRVFIGNQTASRSRQVLADNGITHIVNCTDDMPNVFEGKDRSIAYYRFDIYRYYSELNLKTHRGVLNFFSPMFRWVDAAVAEGHGVLIHCLAGAHRAGTSGTAYVMHATGMDHGTAIKACKTVRSVVDPIGDLSDLLRQLEKAQRGAIDKYTEGK